MLISSIRISYLFLVIVCLSNCDPSELPKRESVVKIDSSRIYEPTLLYGIAIDSLGVSKGKIRWNNTLGSILERFNVSNEAIYNIAREAKDVYDVRKIKAGKEYIVIHENDSLKTAKYFIFEPDKRSYVVYHFGDSIYAELVQLPVKLVEKSIVAVIPSNSSVYQEIIAAGGSDPLVNKLVDIFAWQVDFHGIQSGDRFKIIYEEETVGDEVVGIGEIKGAYFEHINKSYYGILYKTEDKNDYFDETGKSLGKTFLRAPLEFTRISSRYSPRRYHPVLKRYKAHLGTDYAASPGTPIRSVGDGVVVEATYGKYNGNYVKIKHNSNFSTQYLHMQKIKKGIRPGIVVKKGQEIGFVGSTGLANGPHLCYRFWKNGKQVNAMNVNLPPSEPISGEHLNSFLHQKNHVIHQLNLLNFVQSKIVFADIAGQP